MQTLWWQSCFHFIRKCNYTGGSRQEASELEFWLFGITCDIFANFCWTDSEFWHTRSFHNQGMGWNTRPYPRHFLQEPLPAPPILCPSASRGLQWYNRTDEEHQVENVKHGNHLGAGKEKRRNKADKVWKLFFNHTSAMLGFCLQSPHLSQEVSITVAHVGNYTCNLCRSTATCKPTTHNKCMHAVYCPLMANKGCSWR